MHLRSKLIETVAVGNELGECVLWRDSDQSVWWTDVQSCRLYRLSWLSLALTVYETPERLCSFSFLAGTDREILAAFASGLAIYNPEENHIRWLDRPKELGGSLRLNDGRTDPGGRFWVGSMSEDLKPSGRLYCAGKDGILNTRQESVRISNGICWAPDGRTMYFTDSPSRQIRSCTYDARLGTTAAWQNFASVSKGEPDGAITDADGVYWFAHWAGACVTGLSPQGAIVGEIEVPTPHATCPALGGPKGNLMFITSARQGLDASQIDENAGSLFIYETDLMASTNGQTRALIARR
ncbi:SMP-30/gluconolactonase/LRE family protein [Candidatus Phaeomarinobacter ectocarpi]|nr:SMP-30/gluconolactonase/LRE family protein [Candidatus Phaeomarinobacter ectocarpi]